MTSTQFRRGDEEIRGRRHWGNDGERMRRKENIFYRVKRDVIKMERGEQERGGRSGFSVFSCSIPITVMCRGHLTNA